MGFCSFASHLSVGVLWQVGFGFLAFVLAFPFACGHLAEASEFGRVPTIFNIFQKLNQVTIGSVQNTLLIN